jgi:hypothetical protein
MRSREI